MNGRVSKVFRKMEYGKDFSPRHRVYQIINIKRFKQEVADPAKQKSWLERGFKFIKEGMADFVTWQTATIVADPRRRAYQKRKKQYTRNGN